MYVTNLDPEFFLPFLVFSIPIIAIVGGITAGIVKIVGRQRLLEMAQRERIAAIERGIDVSKLPPVPGMEDDDGNPYMSRNEYDRRRSQNLMIGGIITAAVGLGLGLFLGLLQDPRDEHVWAVGILPLSIGLALLLSAWLTRPKNGDAA